MSTTSILMMSGTIGFYLIGFIVLINKAFSSKNKES
ncbi:hypothetical protein EV214_11566 [Marinisporobacter balticus]|uniref:Uncharacterized protein n=1 Tax=Marinisporobacter balticus TaxID=2018667 RepID=A0A4R2L3H7_9FIRM|nr:hypothetical protein EV214_11566 [Marinisporobacter balticus]